MKDPRTVDELKENAVLCWPSKLIEQEKESSIIPLLLGSQDSFLSVLKLASKTPYDWIKALELSLELYPNLFLKHLSVLTNIGGESFKRYVSVLPKVLNDHILEFSYKDKLHAYKLESLLGESKWSNLSLSIDGKGIIKKRELTQSIKDVCMLLLFGSMSLNLKLPDEILDKCVIGAMLGDNTKLELFVKQRYIWVSKITGGATSNTMGYLVQNYVKTVLKELLPKWDFSRSTIPGISQNAGRTLTKFDVVAKSPDGVYWGIEISFQFTTNSVVERKAKLAKDRFDLLHKQGYKVAYVIDGAGNFERKSFVQDLIDYSDCIANLNDVDLKRLAKRMEGLTSGS